MRMFDFALNATSPAINNEPVCYDEGGLSITWISCSSVQSPDLCG